MPQVFMINASAFRNIKLRKLHAGLGDRGLLSLITMWAYTADQHSDGQLGRATASDIELMAQWHGKRGRFAAKMRELGLLDDDPESGCSVHDWAEHNTFLATGSGKQNGRVIDFRVDTALRANPKIEALHGRCGDHGVVSLVRLWAFAAVHRTSGLLVDMDGAGIAKASGWTGQLERFLDPLCHLRLLDLPNGQSSWAVHGGVLTIHDWKKWQPWRYGANRRSDRAKRASEARWSTPETPPPMPQSSSGIHQASARFRS